MTGSVEAGLVGLIGVGPVAQAGPFALVEVGYGVAAIENPGVVARLAIDQGQPYAFVGQAMTVVLVVAVAAVAVAVVLSHDIVRW
jgi:hypothetical protein